MLEWDSIWTWGGRWPRWSVLPPDWGMEMAALHWRKRCWLSTHNKVKSEQCIAATSSKRVEVFQASLKVVREEVGSQLSKSDNKYSTSQGSNHLPEGGCMLLTSNGWCRYLIWVGRLVLNSSLFAGIDWPWPYAEAYLLVCYTRIRDLLHKVLHHLEQDHQSNPKRSYIDDGNSISS